ncbi:hypothetical protein TVAG_476880 [Trichomonas vaginalis G3]|uniref:Uncharacterized protein n=1 Tax=Trichomonas vaginalis (strain ATCC PRA-98 / G3) TaxID=412133 RepID=A2DAB1_TRIV3|nr:uncharacterized protein TVAGG3_1067470 [Trichomonas vaginalis G3]XP_001288643.1 hypothetical protein TVAGG3_0170200 [Trichomonas vaginalis G3]XP_001299546.1 hypothetical protein TVAGG3_0132720 [Trichomonas vaginalis G3]XP_001306596.1 hypothetical protein TVAGG3_0585220 [Trichomonas vaginalis G3]XP_001309569.1 hypothetical protein TVAGG3_0849970 [Trichomonas vaginalis G3]XP_001315387.1 hypothetical protein TVAGG3_0120620 [Trichomonas vaginalis G3]XP_001322229.1 hypothetical protein TVAGG3_0|eukprot:XP_001288472.1 hypothetical protein [Trichomonas vaginalis G3]
MKDAKHIYEPGAPKLLILTKGSFGAPETPFTIKYDSFLLRFSSNLRLQKKAVLSMYTYTLMDYKCTILKQRLSEASHQMRDLG